MALLYYFLDDPEIVVAHFNHGTRKSADDDEKFVRNFCEKNKIKFFSEKKNLGEKVSEEKAREARYDFLRRVAFSEKGEIYTAHHVDDLVETVAINLIRGTGHRGLAPFTSLGIRRPFLEKGWDKKDILKFAAEKKILFREDPTNSSEKYLRNRVRVQERFLDKKTKEKIFKLFLRQKEIEREVDEILEAIVPEDNKFEREWFRKLEDEVCLEIIRAGLEKGGVCATRPQMLDFLDAIRNYLPGKYFNLPEDKLVKINKKDFQISSTSLIKS